jgi:hypothetical protein
VSTAQARDNARTGAATHFERIARALGNVYVRLVLSVAIIASLLPFQWVEDAKLLFLAVFGAEFVLRTALLFRVEAALIYANDPVALRRYAESTDESRWRAPKPGHALLFGFDLLALFSFLPISVLPSGLQGADATRWLRIFRLSRMLLLIGYWAPLVRDLWAVMTRGDRAKQISLMGFVVLVLSFAGAVVIEHVGIEQGVVDFDEDNDVDHNDARFFVHLWWAFRQVQDPGNMLTAPGSAAVVLVSLALTVVGLFMVSFLIGLGTDLVRELLELSRLRPPGFAGHTILVNVHPSTQGLLHMLMDYSKKLRPDERFSLAWIGKLLRNTTQRGLGGARFVVAGEDVLPPEFLRQPELAKIIYRHAPLGDESFLVRTDTVASQRIVLLADPRAPDPDAETIQALLTVTQSLRDADANRQAGGRKRLLIAEVLDESNVPAAHRAILGEAGHTRAFVVPTERLISLFIACVARRPGCEELLDELLTSRGRELYTCFFNDPGLGVHLDKDPLLPSEPHRVMAELLAHAYAFAHESRVIPVGVFIERGADERADKHEASEAELELHINPQAPPVAMGELDGEVAPVRTRECVGFIGISAKFPHVWSLAKRVAAAEVAKHDEADASESLAALPEFARELPTKLDKVLVCDFRSATVGMIEALIKAQSSAHILIMVRSEEAATRVYDDFEAHSKLVERQLLRGEHGRFQRAENQHLLHWIDPSHPTAPRGHVHVEVGDWSSSRRLTALPAGFGEVVDLDAVILISDERSGSDARTAKALMKLETLIDSQPKPNEQKKPGPRVIAEVLDVEFAKRMRERASLRARTVGHCWPRTLVYSIQELRAKFMFQAVVVPHFDRVYAELMSPWGQSFMKLEPKGDALPQGHTSFARLADTLAREGSLLVAIETGPQCGPRMLCVGEGAPGSDTIDLATLRGVWVVAAEPRESLAHSTIG